MTKLQDASVAQALPLCLTRQSDIRALLLAIDAMIGQLWPGLNKLDQTVDLRKAGHEVLDVLAVENQVPNWDESFSLDKKRRLIMAAIPYWCGAGTVAATREIMEAIFTSAAIREWFDYGGTHHYFKIETTDPSVTEDDQQAFIDALENVKRLSAWLEAVVLVLSADPATAYRGVALYDYTKHHFNIEGVSE